MFRTSPAGMGWRRDLPDPRDLGPNNISAMADRLVDKSMRLPDAVDLRQFFSGVRNSGATHASVAHACVDVIEYFERRAFGNLTPMSPLFLHQCALGLQGSKANTGIELRTAWKAIVRFGLPPEDRWPCSSPYFEREPGPVVHGSTDKFDALTYIRLDIANSTGRDTITWARRFLAAGLPLAFGLCIPSSLGAEPEIQYRPTFDRFPFGNAFVAVGYDDKRRHAAVGSLLVRSSWGREWGDQGYGWLPYSFVENQLAVDFWTILRESWLATGEFDAN